jgi:hypothetical protein
MIGPVVAGLVLLTTQHGVSVYQREGAKTIDLVAEGDFAAPPERVRALLLDYTRHPDYIPHLAESVILGRSASSMWVYQRLSLPFIDDRDFTLHVQWGADGQTLWLRFATDNARGPAPQEGVVRVALHEASWRLEPRDGGRTTHASYSLRLDLGGSLPSFLTRSRAGKDLPGLFDALRDQLKK